MKKTTMMLVLFFIAQFTIAQQTHKRITISNISHDEIHELAVLGIDFRCGATMTDSSVQIELSSSDLSILQQRGIQYTVDIENLTEFYRQRAEVELPQAIAELEIEKARAATSTQARSSISNIILDNQLQYTGCDEVDWTTPTNFNLGSMGGCLTLSEMESELDDMRALYPTLISAKADASPTAQKTHGNTLGSAGNQWAGQTIYYVRIHGNQSAPEGSKPQMLFTSMIHSREVSALMGNIFFMWYLLENYNTDPAIKHLVDNNELYFIPVVNPDGLRWNETIAPGGGGFQRKNLRPNAGDSGSTSSSNTSRGVDLNRNFNYFWGSAGSGSSGTPSSDSYRGPSAASEPETQIIEDFVLARNFKTALWHHSFADGIPHPYGGNPTFVSGREDEMHKWHEDMTKYNRYVSGATIFTPANGIADDWMVGGAADSNGSTGSGQNILATTPENGHSSEGGFWPTPSNIVPIAKRMVRINFMNILHGGKYATFHDMTQSDVTSLTSNLTFGIERVGQTASNFTLTVTPISSNIASINSPAVQTGMTILEQRNVTAQLQLNAGIQPNEKIEYKVELKNDENVTFYEANFVKYYQPSVLFTDNPDSDLLSNWNSSGVWATSTSSPWSGSRAIKDGTPIPYANNRNNTLTTANTYNFSTYSEVLVQFFTKWDLERNFDFVELQGSTNGSSWTSLCGKYNKPSAPSTSNDAHGGKPSSTYAFQQNNSTRVYDGDRMDKWVMEEIIIDASTNAFLLNASNAQFRFVFRSDSGNASENYSTTSEGFFIDDFKIIGIQIPCETTVAPSGLTAGTITTASAILDWDDIPSATYDLRYRIVGTPSWTEVTNISESTYTITGLSSGTNYEAQVRTRCVSATSSYSSSANFTTVNQVACTSNTIDLFPYNESFESGFGFWEQAVNTIEDDIDWTRNSGGTPSGSTGPSSASNGSQYLFTEASSVNTTPVGSPNKVAILEGPCVVFTGYKDAQIEFDYHMFGSDMGSLNLEVSIDNGSTYTSVFNIAGQQQTSNGASWETATVDLSLYDNQTIRLRFRAVTGADFRSDISIDNINITAVADPTLSIDDVNVDELEETVIYPNPFNTNLSIKLSPRFLGEDIFVELYDISGRKLVAETKKNTNGTVTIDALNRLSNGSYFVKVSIGNSTKNSYKKLLIKN